MASGPTTLKAGTCYEVTKVGQVGDPTTYVGKYKGDEFKNGKRTLIFEKETFKSDSRFKYKKVDPCETSGGRRRTRKSRKTRKSRR
jgi:hypothetical protein